MRFTNILKVLFITSCLTGCKPMVKKHKPITYKAQAQQIEAIVSYLASDTLQGRDTGSEGIEKAANYITSKFKSWGIKPYFKTYRDAFKVNDLNAYNIVGVIEGKDPKLKNEFVVLSAHYDHIGIKSNSKISNDSIANGANDNASGVSTVLTLANYFSAEKNNRRSVLVVLFSAEERGLLGAYHLSEKLKMESMSVYTVLNFEMLGVPFSDRDYDVFVTGYDTSNMAKVLNEYANFKLVGASDVAKKYNLFKASDNYPFYKNLNIPSQTISSCDLSNYEYYHHVDDEAKQLDYKHMESVINKLIPVVTQVTNSNDKDITLYEH